MVDFCKVPVCQCTNSANTITWVKSDLYSVNHALLTTLHARVSHLLRKFTLCYLHSNSFVGIIIQEVNTGLFDWSLAILLCCYISKEKCMVDQSLCVHASLPTVTTQ